MPIKWTPERDQTLLLKIIETSEVSANVAKISETWPATEEAPTPRAIQERIHKIRAMAGGKGTGTFKMAGTVGGRNGASSAKSSPAKAPTPKSTTKTTAESKRKRVSEDDDEPNGSTPVKAENNTDAGSTFWSTLNASLENSAASKKPKTNSTTGASANGIKEEDLQQMDGGYDAHFFMPGEI
ncbi:MAG: hypothetical protein Q9221_007430 [Calogaya cf. arnoldii]